MWTYFFNIIYTFTFVGNQTRDYKCYWGGSPQGCEWTFSVKREIGNKTWFEGAFPEEENRCNQASSWNTIKNQINRMDDVEQSRELKLNESNGSVRHFG